MLIEDATVRDAVEILALQKLAYQSEAALFNDYTIPPLTQTLEEITAQFEREVFLKAVLDGKIIGSVRAYLQNGTCYIGRVIVHPDYQGRGIGKQLMHAMESRFCQAERYELFTGEKSVRNLAFYGKLGYAVYDRKPLTEVVMIVFLQKTVSRRL